MVPNETPVLYTSQERDGALAEIVYYWSQLSPLPSKPVTLHRLHVTTTRTIRLDRDDLESLSVERDRYEEPNYQRTQEIGAAIAYLGYDGLVAPSARWPCDNLMLFPSNSQDDDAEVKIVESNEVDWQEWAKAQENLSLLMNRASD
jgi:hypothetical protein